jgi:hypothetical protein
MAMQTAFKCTSGFGEIVETLRANKKVPHILVLGMAAVVGFTATLWQAATISSDMHAYIDAHGWTAAMERLDMITEPLWKGKNK